MTRIERITEWTVLPTGMEDGDVNSLSFAVSVRWRGTYEGKKGGGWSISRAGSELSRSRQWSHYVPRFRRWQHRWATFEEAQAIAREVVDGVVMNGRTYAEWEAFHAARKEGSA